MDASIGRLQAALATATNDVTVAAANINFDFTLVKFEAPKEYQQLGLQLSPRRKQDAETGKSHVTARRLAALFEGCCPPTPKLVSAYGQRVSEIAKKANDSISTAYSESIFAAYTGIDATSIWAAATSTDGPSRASIQVHLLAYMLASIWGSSQATSIWAELVHERREYIASSLEQGVPLPFSAATAAAQQEISRTQLAEWDASARSWVQTANTVMAKKQTQVKLILKNVNLNFGKDCSVYPSVMQVWRTALETMEHLLSGVPQEVHDGAALLGLSAWNLYTDIHVFGSKVLEVNMQDRLVHPSGVLSVGCSPSHHSSQGINWSLSLGHMRYYGSPVPAEARLQEDNSRLSFEELRQVVLGWVLESWRITAEDQDLVLQALLSLSRAALQQTNGKERSGAFDLLRQAIEDFQANEDTGRRLVELGRRRPYFLHVYEGKPFEYFERTEPLFGITDPGFLLSLFKCDSDRVMFLRRIATRCSVSDGKVPFILYHPHDSNRMIIPQAHCNLDTAVPMPHRVSSNSSRERHLRWVFVPSTDDSYAANSRVFSHTTEKVLYMNKHPSPFIKIGSESFDWVGQGMPRAHYTFHFGSRAIAAIFTPSPGIRDILQPSERPEGQDSSLVDLRDVIWALDCGLLDLISESSFTTRNTYNSGHAKVTEDLFFILNFLEQVCENFKTLSGDLISSNILSEPIMATDAAKAIKTSFEGVQTPSAAGNAYPEIAKDVMAQTFWQFSLLSYLVAGCNIHHNKFPNNLMGIAAADSLFVRKHLLQDPLLLLEGDSIVRILGNLGQPGFVLFSSVDDPLPPEKTECNWRIEDVRVFDGKPEDTLSTTSMHLLFTDWKSNLDVLSTKGSRDNEFTTMESVISIREKGDWVADIDLVKHLRSRKLWVMLPKDECDHELGLLPNISMKSVESWTQLRDLPAGDVVVRASGNWLARLAVCGFLAQCAEQEKSIIGKIIICPASVCWTCARAQAGSSKNIYVY